MVRRPPGVRIDNGGTGKGLAADLLAARLAGYADWVVDCGGDVRVGGRREVEVAHPFTGRAVHTLQLADQAVATSGLDVRIWRTPDGAYAHPCSIPPRAGRMDRPGRGHGHRADRARGRDAVQGRAPLRPGGARRALAEHGGLIVHDDGEVERVRTGRERAVVRLRAPRGVAA